MSGEGCPGDPASGRTALISEMAGTRPAITKWCRLFTGAASEHLDLQPPVRAVVGRVLAEPAERFRRDLGEAPAQEPAGRTVSPASRPRCDRGCACASSAGRRESRSNCSTASTPDRHAAPAQRATISIRSTPCSANSCVAPKSCVIAIPALTRIGPPKTHSGGEPPQPISPAFEQLPQSLLY